jgi:hypothetical protein
VDAEERALFTTVDATTQNTATLNMLPAPPPPRSTQHNKQGLTAFGAL